MRADSSDDHNLLGDIAEGLVAEAGVCQQFLQVFPADDCQKLPGGVHYRI